MEYPKYVSHKEVGAVKIRRVDKGSDGSITVHLEGGFDAVTVPHAQRNHKPHPEVGWYLVQYADGYISFSPAKAFEEGYTAVAEPADDDEESEVEPEGHDGEEVTPEETPTETTEATGETTPQPSETTGEQSAQNVDGTNTATQ